MIVWSGAGILVVVIGVVLAGAGMGIGETIAQATGLPMLANVGGCLGAFGAAALLWFWGRRLNDPAKGRTLVDPQTGQTVVLRRSHTLFWINMQWWAIPMALLGVVLLFAKPS